MKKLLFLLILLSIERSLHAQYVYTIKADSVKITNSCDTAELIIENHTQNVPGFLFNKGRGRTEFRRATLLNDSTVILGGDTLLIRGGDYSLWKYDNNNNLIHKPFSGDSVKVDNKLFYVNGNMTQTGSLFTIGPAKVNVANSSLIFSYNQPVNPTGTGNVAIGLHGLFQSLSTGGQNVAIGDYTMTAVSTGSANVAVGPGALQRLTSGIRNVSLGYQSMQWVTTSSENVDVGGFTSNATVGNNNVFIGTGGVSFDGLAKTIGSNNIHIGKRASGAEGRVSTNDNNIVVGSHSYTNATTNTTIIGNGLNTALSNVFILGKPNQHILVGSGVDNGAKFQVSGTGIFSDTLTATTMNSEDNSNRVATTAFVKNAIGAPALTIITAGTTDFTAAAGTLVRLPDLSGAGSHSVTLPSASAFAGQRIYLWNMNNSGNSWTFSSSITLPNGATSNSIANQSTIELISDGSVWLKWN